MYEVKSYYYTIDVCLYKLYIICYIRFCIENHMGALPHPRVGKGGRYAPLATLLNILSYQPCLFSLILTSYTNMQHIQRILDIIFCICLNVLPFSRSTRISMVVFL